MEDSRYQTNVHGCRGGVYVNLLWACVAVLFLACVVAPVTLAQTTTSSLSGTVTDNTGAVLPGTVIEVVNQSSGQHFSVKTNGSGGYVITNVPVGTYTVSASAKNFRGETVKNVQVDAGIGRQENFKLALGSATTTVTVQANANALQTQSAAVGQLVTHSEVQSIQLNGRNPIFLAQLEPGVTTNAPLTNFSFAPSFGGPRISGARNDELLVTLDGAPMLRTRANGTTTGVAQVDTIAQMQILSTGYPARFGGTSGGVLIQVPRFGGQNFHGSIFEYLRNSFFDANTWVRKNSSNPETSGHPTPFRFNQFGWVLDGPVAIPGTRIGFHKKLFFLAAQEYLRYRQTPTQTGIVPTELMRQGNFSELLSSNIFMKPVQLVDPATGAPYPNNIITSGLSPNGLALLRAYPAPDISNSPSFNWEESLPYPQNQRKDTVTLDYLPTPSQQFRFSFLHFTFFQSSPFSTGFNLMPQVWHWPDEVGVLHYTWTLNPRTVNDFTASVSADHVHITNGLSSGLYDRTKYGINYPYIFPAAEKLIPNKIPTIEVQNFTTLNGGPYPSHSGGVIVNLADDFTKIIGNHTLEAGGMWQYSGENNFDQIDVSDTTPGATNNQNGQFIFTNLHNNQPTTGAAVANAALGMFDSYGEIGQKSYTLFRAHSYALYAQDTWRATPRLTLEYGLRYSIFQNYYALWRNQSMFNPAFYNPADAPVVNPVTGTETGGNPLNGVVIPGNGFPKSAQGHVPDSVLNGQFDDLFHGLNKSYSPIVWTDLQPRLGIAYHVAPTTVVRIGAGRYVQRLAVDDTIQLGGNAPFQNSESVTNGIVDNPAGNGASRFPLQLSSQPVNYPSPEAWTWSTAVEQQLKNFATLSISYVGRRGIHLQQLENINALAPGTIQAHPGVQPDALRPFQGFAAIIEHSTRGSSIYNAMQVELKRRMTHNLMFGVAYTWAKGLDYGSSRGYELPDYRNPSLNYGPSDFDIRNVLVVDYVWNLPYLDHSSSWLLRNAFGDWQVSGVTQAQSGEPFSPSTSEDFAGVGPGAGAQLWELTGKPVVPKRFGAGNWFDPSDFVAPAPGTFAPRGTRNAIHGPGFQSWNIALQKPFHIIRGHESNILLFRAEAFNFPNHPNFDNPNETPGSATFGQVTTKGQTFPSDREVQLSLRYSF